MEHARARLGVASIAAAAMIGATALGTPPAMAGGGHNGGGSKPTVVATGLDNPRQLSFTRSGDLLVAEAGEGGAAPCVSGPEGDEVCFGTTGAITMITSRGRQFRVVKGLPSLADKSGASAIGPSDVAARHGSLSILIGLGADPAIRADLPAAGRKLGTLVRTNWRGGLTTVADLAAWEATYNPVNDPDSNPVGMLLDGGKYVVTDAGGNTLLKVGHKGKVTLLAEFEDRLVDFGGRKVPMQAVPTSVATKGWDGAYYVSQLTGFPFPKGAANIYRVDPHKGTVSVYASGLTNVTDLAFDGRSLYAVQLAAEGLLNGPIGSVVKVKPGGAAPADHSTIAGGLMAPYGIAIRNGSAYVTTNAVAKNDGQVVRIRL